MEMRSTTETVRFGKAFRLPGHDMVFPAGVYQVLIEDERLEGLTFDAFRRVATFLRMVGQGASAGRTELLMVSQRDLDAALRADRAAQAAGTGGGVPGSGDGT